MKNSTDITTTVTNLWNRFSLPLAARAASFLSLPIEGGFWASAMPESWYIAALALPFTLDLIADLLVYKYGRIQLSVTKGTKKWRASKLILVFVIFNAVQGWGTSAWQLSHMLDTTGMWVPWLWPLAFATVQPLIGFGVAFAQAVQDGKYDEAVRSEPVQEIAPAPVLIPGQPTHDWWVERKGQINGGSKELTFSLLTEMIQEEFTTVPSRGTLYNWLKEPRP